MPALRAHLATHTTEERNEGEFAPHFVEWAHSMIELLESTRRMVHIHTLEELVVLFRRRGWYPKQGSRANMGMRTMLSEVAEMMGRPIAANNIQLCPPNHPVSLLNWDNMGRMLAEMPPNKRDSFREWLVPSISPRPSHTVGVSAMDAHCHLQMLRTMEIRQKSVPFNFETEPVPAWETAFSLWRGDSAIALKAVVDNRVFPGDWQRPVIKGVTVSHQTVAIKTTYGVHPRLAKSLRDETWDMVKARICSSDCIAIGECGLDYTEPLHSLPKQRELFGKHVALARELEKPLILHLRGNTRVPFSDVMAEALAILSIHTHQRQLIHVHCFTGTLEDYRQWVRVYTNSVFGITTKSVVAPGFADLARQIDLYRLVLETDAPLLSPHGHNRGHPYEVVHQAGRIASLRNIPSWVVLRVTTLNALAFYK